MKHGSRKKGVSVRMSNSDQEKVKQIADRLCVRHSDIVRYAVKSMLQRLGPLTDEACSNTEVLPVFIEHGADLIRAFDLCPDKLDKIINDRRGGSSVKVSKKDLELLAVSSCADSYRRMLIDEAVEPDDETRDITKLIRDYLYSKYLSPAGNASGKREKSSRTTC
jgi:hypothetical protein